MYTVQGCSKWDDLTIKGTKDCIIGKVRQDNFIKQKKVVFCVCICIFLGKAVEWDAFQCVVLHEK